MPARRRRWRILKDFDAVIAPNIVRAFAAGTIVTGLTRSQVARGEALKAIEQIEPRSQNDGKTDDL